jgi:diguanylate cyclase (GGDEF)-like protein
MATSVDPPRPSALIAYVYDLIDRGPELERDALFTMICERALALAGADVAAVWLPTEKGDLRAGKVCGIRPTATGIRVERALVDLVLSENMQIASSAEAPMQPTLARLCEKLEQEHCGAVCAALQRRNEVLGALCLHRVDGGSFEAWETAEVERFARFAALALFQMTERERGERDEVTGFPGRRMLLRSLDDRLADGHPFALACIDFDGLKAVNETLGYEAGNDLIRAVARGVAELLNPGEIVGRLHGRGGDEFVCLLNEATQDALERRCQLLEAALDRAPVPPELAAAYLGVSIGAALANGTTVPGSLFTAAETSMRQRKIERRRSQGRPSEPTNARPKNRPTAISPVRGG